MRARELGSGVATAVVCVVKVPKAPSPVPLAGTSWENTGILPNPKMAPGVPKKLPEKNPSLIPHPSFMRNVNTPADAHPIMVVADKLFARAVKSNTSPSQSTVKLVNVLVVLSKTKDPVGVGLPLVTVKLMVPSVKESAWALGAAKHKAKTRQSIAMIGLNRLVI
jgi:hypothetical protein